MSDEITYSYETVEPLFMPIKEGDTLRVTVQTPSGPVERLYTAGPPVHSDDGLKISQSYSPAYPPYEVVE